MSLGLGDRRPSSRFCSVRSEESGPGQAGVDLGGRRIIKKNDRIVLEDF